MQTALNAFITAKTASNRSERTLEKYQDIIGRFIASAGSVPLETLQPESIEAWLAGHRKTGKSPETILTYYTSLSTWLNWCERRYRLEYNPIEDIDRPRIPKRLPPYLKDHEVTALLAGTQRMLNHLKAEAILRFLLDTGARAGEVCAIHRRNIDLEAKTVLLLGKDQEERCVPIGEKTIAALCLYWQGRLDTLPHAFHAYNGPFTVRGIRSLVRRAAAYGEIARGVYPHLLRHTFAHNWLIGGGDLESLRRILGHSNLQTTQRYSGMAIQDIQEKHSRIRPGDRF